MSDLESLSFQELTLLFIVSEA